MQLATSGGIYSNAATKTPARTEIPATLIPVAELAIGNLLWTGNLGTVVFVFTAPGLAVASTVAVVLSVVEFCKAVADAL